MKNKLLPFTLLFLLTQTFTLSARWGSPGSVAPLSNHIFVAAAATGLNDGSSWANAYNSLQDALLAAKEGDQIWVAQGTYRPDVPGGSRYTSFYVDKNISLYGGFAGTETNLSERGDPSMHPSILSGDLNGDDVVGDFAMNRADNAFSVLLVEAGVTQVAIINGFTIQGGQADGSDANASPSRSGGGLYATGTPTIAQCKFQQNYAVFDGGGVYVNFNGAESLAVAKCTFLNNRALRGGGMAIVNANCLVSESDFQGNAATHYGGGMWYNTIVKKRLAKVLDCNFEKNQATIGGGLRLQALADDNNFIITDCTFSENSTAPLQAGWFESNAGFDCTTYPGADNNSATVEHCTVRNNIANGSGGGGGFYAAGASTGIIADDNLFEGNSAPYGGALGVGTYDGGQMVLDMRNSVFSNNEGMEHGAIEFLEDVNAPLTASIDNCVFDGNKGTAYGSTLGFLAHSNNLSANISSCRFLNNECPTGGVVDGYLYFPGVGFQDSAQISIDNSLFAGNKVAAVFAQDIVGSLSLMNCTVAGNTAKAVRLTNQSGITLQNTILYNPGFLEFEAVGNDASFTSKGGNLIGDQSLAGQLLPSDKQNLDPLFVAADDHQLSQGSPCIDAGNNTGVTADFDLAGALRVQGQRVDMGAFESPFTSAVKTALYQKLVVSPNPALDFLNLQIPEAAADMLQVQVLDPQGKIVLERMLLPGKQLDVQALPSGAYSLKAFAEEKVYLGKFIKPSNK